MLPLTSFIGREKECADIQKLLAQPECQLLTLVGPGGTGKTRLAMQLVARMTDQFADKTAVILLEPLRSAEFFIPTIADTLRYSLSGPEPLQQLSRFLADKELLVLLDNFENILEAADQLLTLLQHTPNVKYLITSREALNLQEEWLYPIGGLPFPKEADAPADPHNGDAIQLFEQRAKRVYPPFSLEAERSAVIKICQLVGGMPLALELAAAWRRTLSCEAIAAEIQHDLEFLSTRLRNVPERHRSIQAIFDQTWSQLMPKEQAAFRRLSVFRGGFRQEAAAEVAQATPRILAGLVEKCLLRVQENGRYHLHELLRQYAAERLDSNPAEAQQAQDAHAAYFIDYLQAYLPKITGHHQLSAIHAIHDELDNVRVAWQWSITQENVSALRRGGAALGQYYQLSGGYLEGLRLFSEATEMLQNQAHQETVAETLRGLLICQGWFHLRLGRPDETERCMRQSETLSQRLGLPCRADFTSDPLAFFGLLSMIKGDFGSAKRYAEQSRQRAEDEQNSYNLQFAYKILSDVHLSQGQLEKAAYFAQQAQQLVQTTGDEWFSAYILNNLGQIALLMADVTTAKIHFKASYDIRHAFDDPEMGVASNMLANIALQEKAFAEAEARFEDSRQIYQKINDKGGVAEAERGLGIAALAQNHLETAQAHFLRALQTGLAINLRPFLLSLLVDVAKLLWQVGQRQRPLTLLTFVAQHAATDHETETSAQQQLERYKLAVAPSLYAAATQLDGSETIRTLCSALLNALSLPLASDAQPETAASPNQPLFDPLTPRELEVLTLMANGRSNPEIAAQLILSIGTVKGYTNKIYGKLGVRNRVEAISRAQALSIL